MLAHPTNPDLALNLPLLLKFETSQKPPKNHRKPAKNQPNHPESQSTNSKNIKIHEGRFTQGVYKTKT